MRLFVITSAFGMIAVGAIQLRDTPQEMKTEQAKLALLGPVLAKLKGLDPRSFGALSGMLGQVQNPQAAVGRPMSFIQYMRDDPQEVQAKLAKLGPILARLRGINPKVFGSISSSLMSVKADEPAKQRPKGAALIQVSDAPKEDDTQKVANKLQALAPVLDKLRGLDGKAFGALSSMMQQAALKGAPAPH